MIVENEIHVNLIVFVFFILVGFVVISTVGVIAEKDRDIKDILGEQNEANDKLTICHEFKQQDITDVNRLMINCVAFANSDYEDVMEYIQEEQPNLKINHK